MKKCSICNIEKEIEEYKKTIISKKSGEFLRTSFCNDCRKKRYKDSKKESDKKYYLNNKEEHYRKNREIIEKDPESYKKYMKEYYEKNKDQRKSKAKEYRDKMSSKEIRNTTNKYRMQNDSLYKLKHNIRGLITSSINRKGFKKNTKTFNILGCSFEEFKNYLESKFEPWMNWNNYGIYNGELNYGWDIDHIIPMSSVINEEDVIKLNNYINLQPLCSYVNRYIKRDNLE